MRDYNAPPPPWDPKGDYFTEEFDDLTPDEVAVRRQAATPGATASKPLVGKSYSGKTPNAWQRMLNANTTIFDPLSYASAEAEQEELTNFLEDPHQHLSPPI